MELFESERWGVVEYPSGKQSGSEGKMRKGAFALAHRSLSHFCAQEWIRTITPLQALRPEHSASTNFATWAGETFSFSASCLVYQGCKYKLPFLIPQKMRYILNCHKTTAS